MKRVISKMMVCEQCQSLSEVSDTNRKRALVFLAYFDDA